MRYNDIDFNEDHWKDKTEAEFIAHEKHHGLSKEELKEVYSILNIPDSEVAGEVVKNNVKQGKGIKIKNNSPVDPGASDQKLKKGG